MRIALSPLTVEVRRHNDGDGEVGTRYGIPTPALAEAVTTVVNSCVTALPVDRARQVGAFVAGEPATLSLLMGGDVARVHVLLDPGGDADLFELGSLSDEVVH